VGRKRKELKFEEALERLEKIVSDLEGGTGSLDEAIARFEEGLALGRECQDLLEKTRLRIQKLTRGEDGGGDSPEAAEGGGAGGEETAPRGGAAGRRRDAAAAPPQASFLEEDRPDDGDEPEREDA
jgi:exodeoxyribonuclease VII small subunit